MSKGILTPTRIVNNEEERYMPFLFICKRRWGEGFNFIRVISDGPWQGSSRIIRSFAFFHPDHRIIMYENGKSKDFGKSHHYVNLYEFQNLSDLEVYVKSRGSELGDYQDLDEYLSNRFG